MKLRLRKIKPLTFLLLFLTSTIMTFSFLSGVKAETKIISINPSSGNVGATVQLIANITTVDGQYKIMFEENERLSGNATGNNVTVPFTVPHASEGAHNVTIIDTIAGEDDTTTFTVLTSYSCEPTVPKPPAQIQEGENVTISVNMTGGKSNYTYPNIKVQTPGNLTYEALNNITTNDMGDFYGNLTYPEDFSNGAHTNFTGEYKILFNASVVNQFFIGLTNCSKYHREEFVGIRAVGYQANETVTINVTFVETIGPLNSTMVNASQQGIINATWMVPWNASIGDYSVTIASDTTTKLVRDSQLFSVPGYQIDVYTRNLAGDVVPQILVEALDEATNTTYSNTTTKNGTRLWLEKGNHTFEAFWNNVTVNETQVTITEEHTYNLTCELTNIKITVKDKNEIRIPFVNLAINYQYVTTKDNKVENGSRSGETDLSGIFYLNSTLPHITYTVNASRYERVFNTNNKTIEDLPAEKWFNITILCPAKTLTLNITGHHRNPLPNARIELIEQMGGISYNETTNDAGIATIKCTFGNYTVKVYMSNIFLNRTFVEVFNDTHIEIHCKLYNLTVSVKIVDYFGQPIPNANVALQREDLPPRPNTTKSDGVATFSDFIGGSVQITVYLNDQTQPCLEKTFSVESSTTIGIKIEKYVLVVGILVETSHLATALIIAAAILLILSMEIYRRKRVKPKQTSS